MDAAHLRTGSKVRGLLPAGLAEVTDLRRVGDGVFLTYRDEYGASASRMLVPAQLALLTVDASDGTALDADPDDFWLAVQACRLRYAHLHNPLLALTSARVDPLPHQVQAVYDRLLQRHPQRFLLADDPGAGKTVMAGLYIREAMARGWVQRVLIVVPASLSDQWQEEMRDKFGMNFVVFDPAEHLGGPGRNRFADLPALIIRLDQLARNEHLRAELRETHYDLAVVDEAHKLTARHWGTKVIKSKRFELGEQLRDQCPSLLLMTATPHNGKEPDFQLFLSLLEDGAGTSRVVDAGDSGLMRRLVKEQLVYADGTRLFPERRASTVAYRLSPGEHELYEEVTEYVRHEMNKVTGEDTRRTVGFALLVLQRRLASSPEAILRSLTRRRDRLQAEAARMRDADDRLAATLQANLTLRLPEQQDEWTRVEQERWEDEASTVATAARTVAELEFEVTVLDRLVTMAERVHAARVDAKWEALAGLLGSPEMYDAARVRRKIIIFTEHRDTLEYLQDRLGELFSGAVGVEIIHGAVGRGERRLAQIRFTQDRHSSILLATDAAGEGVNLQVAHLMVNYDIPWNPNRLEQRFGRIHRIGQKHSCHLWNLVAVDTREGEVFGTLLDKLEVQREALGDRVFDVLGDVLTDADLTGLLTLALQGAPPSTIADAGSRLEADIRRAVAVRERTMDVLTPADLADLRTQMTRAASRSFQPVVVQDFLSTAMARFQGDLAPAGNRWTAAHVPARVRARYPGTVPSRYDLLTFDQTDTGATDLVSPELVAPGHPLLSALVDLVMEEHGPDLLRGIVLVDDRSAQDHVLLSVLTREPEPRMVTVSVSDQDVEAADPAGFTDLPAAGGPGTDPERIRVEDVLARAPQLIDLDFVTDGSTPIALDGVEVLAVAYVRGTMDPQQAKATRSQREQVRAALAVRGQVRDGAAHAGWDFELELPDDIVYVRVASAEPRPERAQESQARIALGHRYFVVGPGDPVPG